MFAEDLLASQVSARTRFHKSREPPVAVVLPTLWTTPQARTASGLNPRGSGLTPILLPRGAVQGLGQERRGGGGDGSDRWGGAEGGGGMDSPRMTVLDTYTQYVDC